MRGSEKCLDPQESEGNPNRTESSCPSRRHFIVTMRKQSSCAVLPLPSLFIFLLAVKPLLISPAFVQGSSYESDRIVRLPGQPLDPVLSQFSGHITVNESHGRALFYWFFEAQEQPETKPLLLWLNGGPGCSSVGTGAAVELGPLTVKTNGTGLEYNKYAWNKEANLLFLESPVGVGFSYSNTSSDYAHLDDAFAAEDAYAFLVNWLNRFPQYQSREFYLSGESYAGHYVPQLAELITDRNNSSGHVIINLKGYIVGNPSTDDYLDTTAIVQYAWSHSVIDDTLYLGIVNACDFRLENVTEQCVDLIRQMVLQYSYIDKYNIYAPECYTNSNYSRATAAAWLSGSVSRRFSYSKVMALMPRLSNSAPSAGYDGYDPCFDNNAVSYFNRADVKAAFRANTSGRVAGDWGVCNNSLSYNQTVTSVLPVHEKLIKAGLRIWIYSGDADGVVPVIGTRYCVQALGLPLKNPWRPWYHEGQVAGRFVEYQGLTMATVRGAGHLVPLNKPSEALRLINTFLAAKTLPTQR